TDTTHLTYLHRIYDKCPSFKAVEGEYGVKLYILEPRAKANHVALRKRGTVLPTINRKSRELRPKNPGEPQVTLQQAIWIVPIDDTHCEEMRLTVYPEKPKERRYHSAFMDQAKERDRKPYDRRFYGEIKGIVPLEDKAMVESQGPIVDRSLEHPGYSDRGILLLRKMIRDGIAEVANGGAPRGVLKEDLPVVDLDIGVEQYAVGQVPAPAPELAIKVSDSLRERGIEMVDAPLSGADIGATNGNLTIFVGGTYEAYQRCLPVLQHVGRTVTYLGKNGNGQIGKRINQVMQALSELAIYEGLLLAKKSGLDLKMFARAASG